MPPNGYYLLIVPLLILICVALWLEMKRRQRRAMKQVTNVNRQVVKITEEAAKKFREFLGGDETKCIHLSVDNG